jgi:tetrahydromethanopterin S-methyltransferase subunit A
MRAKIWENPTDIQGKIIPWLADVSDTALLSRMLKSKTSREIKEAVIDELIKNTTPDQALSTFETIINDASADQLKTLLDTFDNLENSIFQLYVKAASHQDNFIKALALIAHTESWSFDKIDRTIFSKITNSEQRAMLLKEIGTPLFTSPRDALGWIKGLENFIATEQRLSPQAIQNISEEQLSIIKDQIDNLDTLNTIDLKDVHTVIAKITKRLSESQTALETSISILTKINTIAEARKKEPAPELIKRIQTKLPIINNVALWLNGVVAYLTIKDLDTISNTAQNIRTILTGIVPALTSQDVKTATEQAVGALETLMNNIAKIKAIKKANTL